MKVMEEALSEWELPAESIKEFAIPSLSSELMYDAYYGIACGLSVEEVKIYTKSCYTNEQRNTILWGLLDGLSKDEINSKINDFNKNKKER